MRMMNYVDDDDDGDDDNVHNRIRLAGSIHRRKRVDKPSVVVPDNWDDSDTRLLDTGHLDILVVGLHNMVVDYG